MNRKEDAEGEPEGKEGPPEKVRTTPLPKLKMVACCATFLTEGMCVSSLLPFVGLFVAHLKGISVEEAGYFSGILVGLFMLGQVVSAKMWGYLSDVYGRKVPLTFGLFAGGLCMLLFGMSPNIWVCCILRFIHGFFNGNVLIAKIIVADITDSTNAALGFSAIGVMWCVGTVLGPAIGGFLYDPFNNPKLQWMHVKEGSYLARNPAFLPSFFIFAYIMCSFLLCLIVLPETNVHRRKSFRNVPVIGWLIHWAHPKEVTMVDIDDGAAVVNAEPAKPPTAKTMTYLEALRDPVIRTISILYMCISATDMSFGETLPLWLIAAPDVGGLGMFSDKVGLLMLLFALPTFFSNMFFARMYKAFNNSGLLWRYCAIGVTIVVLAVPFAASIPRSVAFWYLLLFGSLKSCFFTVNFNIVHLHTAKAAPPGTIGCVYGISQSFSFSMRCVVPFIVAPAFAWSISGHHIFPFNHYFVFFVSVVPMLYSVYLTLTGPIERTAEEMAAWANEASQENRENTSDDSENKAEEPQAYTSLVNSFAMSAADSLLSQLLEVESTRRDLMREWLNRTAPRGRGKELDAAAKQLEHEDWRAVVTDSESEDERGLV